MPEGSGTERWIVELGALRQELAQLRKEQQELAHEVSELAQTFRALAMHLGVAAEPYKKGVHDPKGREVPGFG